MARDRWVNVVLNPNARIDSQRVEPAADLASLVEWYWPTRWNLGVGESHVVEILTDTSFHLVFDFGRSDIVGVNTRLFTRRLEGDGRILGVRFKPGAFRPLTRRSATEFTNRRVPLERALDVDPRSIEADVFGPDDDSERIARIEAFLRAQRRAPDPQVELVKAIVARIESDRDVVTVETLASDFDLKMRSLQRLFKDYVGVGPKWVLRRARLLEAAAEIRDLRPLNLAKVAAGLGYFDQAHFTHDFKAVVGRSPVAYCRERHGY